MKMTKKFVLVAAAAAMIFGMVGCAIGDVKFTGNSGTGTKIYKVKQTNENDHNIRGIKPTGVLDRAQGTCVITMKNQSSSTDDGVCGFMTCYQKNKGMDATGNKAKNYGTYNFLVVGIRCLKGQPMYYISYYCNIDEKNLSTDNFGAGSNIKAKVDPDCTDPYEIEIVKYTPLTRLAIDNKTKTLTAAIKFTGKDTGDIDVEILKDVETFLAAATTSGGERCAFQTVSKDIIGNSDKSAKGKLSVYANIYKKQTLDAEWGIYDVSWSEESTILAADDDIDYGEVIFTEF